MLLLLIGQYATTALNARTSQLFGWSREQTFQVHGTSPSHPPYVVDANGLNSRLVAGLGGFLLLLYGVGLLVAQYKVDRFRQHTQAKAERLASGVGETSAAATSDESKRA